MATDEKRKRKVTSPSGRLLLAMVDAGAAGDEGEYRRLAHAYERMQAGGGEEPRKEDRTG
jgi:hypothetical protein